MMIRFLVYLIAGLLMPLAIFVVAWEISSYWIEEQMMENKHD
jgi:hypothetical protein